MILAVFFLGAALGALIGWQATELVHELRHEDEFGRLR